MFQEAFSMLSQEPSVLLLDKKSRKIVIPENAFLMHGDLIRAAGYGHAKKIDRYGGAGGYDQARLAQQYAGLGGLCFPVIPVVTTPITIQSPLGLYSIAKTVAGVITITVPAGVSGAPSAQGDDGKQQIWFNNQTQANIVSFTGANLLSVGVAKTTITFTAALVGEFARTMSIGGVYICLDIVTTGGGTLA